MKKPKIFLRISQVANCGVGYYRQWLPLKKLEEQGKIELRVLDFNWGEKEIVEPYEITLNGDKSMKGIEWKDRKIIEYSKWADLIYICRDETIPYLATNKGLSTLYKKPLLVDVDDYVQFTRPHNPGYQSFHPGNAFNHLNLTLLGITDGVTCSTKFLKKEYSKNNKKITVCPNSLDLKWRSSFDNVKPTIAKKKDEIRIGWAGSAAHYENLKMIVRPLREIMLKYPNVTFHYTGLFGDLFEWPDLKRRIKKVKFASLKNWPKKLKQMGLDIALAPLADNNFNRAKSNLRILEYWAAKYPVIASPVEPYKFIKKNIDGILAKEESDWYNKIEELILNEQKRKNLVLAGTKRLEEQFDVEKNCNIWLDVFKKHIK